jgi:2-methylcitrate dehydratase PrpD
MKLDAGACANALSLAANAAGGLREWVDAGTEEYPLQAGFAARNGLLSANLAAAGTVAAGSALTGRAGFFRAYATHSDRYAQRVCERLGEEYEFELVTYKPYPICQFLSGVVRGTIEVRARAEQRAPRALAIHMHPFEADFIGNRYAGPYSSFQQTLISAPFCAALAWTNRAVTFAGLHEFTNEAVLALVRKISVVSDTSRARYSPRLVVTLDDQTVLEWEETEGANPYRLTWDAAMQMNLELCAEAGVAERKAQALAAAVSELDRAPNVRRLVSAAADCAAEARLRVLDGGRNQSRRKSHEQA